MALGIQQLFVKEFTQKSPPFEHPQLERFHHDLLSGFDMIPDYEWLEKGNNNSYHNMAAEILDDERWKQEISRTDLFILAYSFPNIRPDISIVNYIMDRYGAGFLSFAINDMGFAAPFMALHIINQYLKESGFSRAMLLVMDQTSLPYKTKELQEVSGVDTGALLLMDRVQGSSGNIVDIRMNYMPSLNAQVLNDQMDEWLVQKRAVPQRLLILAHPSLCGLLDPSYEVRGYDTCRWSAAPFMALSSLLSEEHSYTHVCVLHYEEEEEYLYQLLLEM